MKNWDVIIIGGGIIGLSLAIALRKRGASVLVVERAEPAREASHAAAGMIEDFGVAPPLKPLAIASARMYPEFAHQLHDESGINVDLRDHGTLLLAPPEASGFPSLLPAQLAGSEPSLKPPDVPIIRLQERSVDPRELSSAALKAARHREVDIVSGSPVQELLIAHARVDGVVTNKSAYHAPVVVNCAGAWAGQVAPYPFPTRPVKGQMLSVVGGPKLNHVIRSAQVYLVPRTDGRIVIGATMEEAGYDKRTDADSIQRLHRAATGLVPALAQGRIHEAWAGLRPGTPDDLPILGATPTPGYFAAAGHFRDGILLAPVTAHVMAQLVSGETPDYDLSAFSAVRFALTASLL